MAVCCQNLMLGALSGRSTLSVLVGALFKKFSLFLNMQDHTSIHDSHVVQEWLSLQADVKLIDWPPQVLVQTSSRICGVRRTTHETLHVFPSRNSDELWTLVSDMWDEVASSQLHVQSLIKSMTQRMKSVAESQSFWTSNYRGQYLKMAPFRAKLFSFFMCT